MKNIILGVTGSIAAYKAAELVRRLKQQGAEVQVVMTEHAQAFITPLTLQALSGKPVLSVWSAAETDAGMDHIALARWADVIVCAPASANFIAHLAHGMADDLLSTLCLATSSPIVIAPAMNPQMWANSATQANVSLLQERGVKVLGPTIGEHACGEEGLGRMLEPDDIIQEIFASQNNLLAGQHVLITAGPTHEAIDPVRYLTNHSSGKMGFALAEAARAAGANVTVVAGPTNLTLHPAIQRIDVISAQQMLDAVLQHISHSTIFVGAAAVADYHLPKVAAQKIKKSKETLTLELIPTTNIIDAVAQLKNRPLIVGFALETENLLENARKKLQEKKLDMLIANELTSNSGFNTETNAVKVLYAQGETEEIALMTKSALAQQLISCIASQLSRG